MDKNSIMPEMRKRMDGALGVLDHDLKGLRTGRASANFLDPVVVEAYGDKVHISQVATVNAPEARTITAQVWDKGLVKAVEKAISNAGLGVTPSSDGQLIRITLPLLSQERRAELIKLAHKYGEQSKIAVRNVRRDGMEQLKKMEKDGTVAKDEHHQLSDSVQKVTDEYIKKIDELVAVKEKDISAF